MSRGAPTVDPRPSRSRRRFLRCIPTIAVGLLLAGCSDAPQSLLDPKGPYAEQPDDLFQWTMWIALVIFILVQGLIIYAAVRYRQKPGDDALPVQTHGNTKLEITWTLIPALILAGIAVPTVRTIFQLATVPDEALTIEVIGHRWWWEYRYPDELGGFHTANELTIPVDTPIHLEMTALEAGSADRAVIHSYWVPALAGKQDVVPGRITTLNLEARETGRFLGQCTEYCGLSHANMRNRAVVLPQEEFDQWVELQNQPAAVPEPGTLAAEGRDLLFEERVGGQACVSCHTIRGAEVEGQQASGTVGPDLTHLMSRREYAGAIFPLYEVEDGEFQLDQPNVDGPTGLKAWLRDPPAMKPMQPEFGLGMPNLNLTEEEIEAIVAYLITLE